MNIYKSKPLKYENEIPIFSFSDEYIENYNKIGKDVLKNIDIHGENPFMPENYWNSIENSTLLLIEKYIKKNDKILDVGVGLGRLLAKINQDVEKFGVDIDINQLVKSKDSINVCLSKVEEIPYIDELFDIIICTDVLEHVIDLNLAIKNIIDCLKLNGKLIIRVPFRENLSNYLEPSYPYKFAHLRNFDENSLQLLFNKIFDMNVLDISYCGYVNSRTKVRFFNEMKIPQKAISVIINITSFFSKSLEMKLIKYFILPIEINMVLKKKCNTKK